MGKSMQDKSEIKFEFFDELPPELRYHEEQYVFAKETAFRVAKLSLPHQFGLVLLNSIRVRKIYNSLCHWGVIQRLRLWILDA
jgi:hypothetical protein